MQEVSSPIDARCGLANLRRATRAMTGVYEEAFRGTGLRATQFTCLQVLARAGEVTQGDLGRLLRLDSTTLTRTLAPLIADGSIAQKTGADRREKLCGLTRAGRKRLERALTAWNDVQTRMRAALGSERWDRLQDDLLAAARAASDDAS